MKRLFVYIFLVLLGMSTLLAATKKKITDPDEALEKAREAFYAYNPGLAREMFDEYEALMKKKKREIPEDVGQDMSRLILMENMLSRVERITVVDTLVVDADGFFRHYRLSPEAGRFVSGETVRMPDVEMAYVPQNHTEFLYSVADSTGSFVLMGADILDDGTVDRPAPLTGEDLSGGGNAEYPFLMTDGLTLYYANDGEASLGGYDIFLTRRDDDGSLLQPQNIGMPFNSPYDDYLMAVDEVTGAGWWASDRNQIPGKLTIYIFAPSDTRINVGEDDPDLVSLACLDDIDLVKDDAVANRIKASIESINAPREESDGSTSSFEIAMGDAGLVYRSLADFKSRTARQAMAQAIDARKEISRTETRLMQLREQWSKGNKNNGVTILNLEQQLSDARRRETDAVNRAIADELRYLRN